MMLQIINLSYFSPKSENTTSLFPNGVIISSLTAVMRSAHQEKHHHILFQSLFDQILSLKFD